MLSTKRIGRRGHLRYGFGVHFSQTIEHATHAHAQHAQATSYAIQKFIDDPDFLSRVIEFDIPLIGDISGLDIVHLQCHIGTDTLSLARRGGKRVVGLDFSPAALKEGNRLIASAGSGEKVSFVEASTYDALNVLEASSFDMVFTGIGAICWLPRIREWAKVVHALLKPGGRLFIREVHPILQSLDDSIKTDLAIRYAYFETKEPTEFNEQGTYVEIADANKQWKATRTAEWNHGLGEIVQGLLDVGMMITGLAEHTSAPWEALPGQMVKGENGRSIM